MGNIAQVTVDALIREYNANPAYIKAVIGPGICGSCYEVSEDVAVQFQKKYLPQEAEHIVTPGKRVGKYQLDLQLANYYNLIHAGIARSILRWQMSVPAVIRICCFHTGQQKADVEFYAE